MSYDRAAFFLVLAVQSAAFDFTNNKITACARESRASGSAWLTSNNASYICTNEQWDKYYDPATSLGFFLLDDGATDPAQAACPKSGDVIKCFVFASWGQVAGGPDAVGDTCSTQMGSGSQSCCAKACTSSGLQGGVGTSTKCQNNQWMPKAAGTCGTRGDGYCDCCPNCYDCVHGPPPPSPAPSAGVSAKSHVANRFCDCRKGLDVSPDYSPCWNSALDCFGDDGQIAYMPEDVASSCVGKSSCYVLTDSNPEEGVGFWSKCTSSQASSCTASSTESTNIPDQPKAKGMFLCGPGGDVVV